MYSHKVSDFAEIDVGYLQGQESDAALWSKFKKIQWSS